MRNLVAIAAFLLLAPLSALALTASAPAIASESQITVTGDGIPAETFNLPRIYGDWFATPADAHASLTLQTAPAGAHQAQLSIEWDGKSLTQTIREANNSGVGGNNRFGFSLHLSGSGANNQDAMPRGADAITVTITSMDDLTLDAAISGSVTGSGPLQIAGTIKIHRDVAPGLVSGSFGDCDPHIRDKLAGAEWRSPSECEVKFDTYVRQGLAPVIAPVEANLTQAGWVENKKPDLDPIDSIPRHSEKAPYQLVNRGGGAFAMAFSLRQDSPVYQQYNQAAMDAMQTAMKAGGAGGSMDVAQNAARALQENTSIDIAIVINQASAGITDFKGGHTVTPLAGGGYSIEVPYAQPATGGGPDAAVRATYLLLGAWAPPGSSTQTSGPENIQVKGNLNPSRLMAVQNVRIRIQGGTALAQQVIKLMDWSALQQLIAGK
jgi:hypothetical protein